MSSINKAIIIGNLGKDPEVKYLASGDAVCNIAVATSESWKDKQTGQQQERTEWHNVSAFGRLAEIMGQYLHKGSKVYIEGQLQTRKWHAQDGSDRYTTEIKAREMKMLGSKSDSAAPQPAKPQRAPQQQERDRYTGGAINFDDAVPF